MSELNQNFFRFKVEEAMKHKAEPESLTLELFRDLRKEITNRLYAPTTLVPNPTFDVAAIWPDKIPNQLRATILGGKWKTEKKEKWYMQLFFKDLRMELRSLKKEYKDLWDELYSRNPGHPGALKRIEDLEPVETIDCHTCGCVVRKEIAFRGHDRVEREESGQTWTGSSSVVGDAEIHVPMPVYQEVTHETWYCKLHKRGKKAYGSK